MTWSDSLDRGSLWKPAEAGKIRIFLSSQRGIGAPRFTTTAQYPLDSYLVSALLSRVVPTTTTNAQLSVVFQKVWKSRCYRRYTSTESSCILNNPTNVQRSLLVVFRKWEKHEVVEGTLQLNQIVPSIILTNANFLILYRVQKVGKSRGCRKYTSTESSYTLDNPDKCRTFSSFGHVRKWGNHEVVEGAF